MCALKYSLAISWQSSTLNSGSLPLIKALWLGPINEGNTSLSLLQSNLKIHLQITLEQDLGLKSKALIGALTLERIASQTSVPMSYQQCLKNPLE